jgi:hypothetical protein
MDSNLRRLRGPFGASLCEASQGRLRSEPRAEIPSEVEGPRVVIGRPEWTRTIDLFRVKEAL